MVQITKSLAIAAMILTPALAAPVFQAEATVPRELDEDLLVLRDLLLLRDILDNGNLETRARLAGVLTALRGLKGAPKAIGGAIAKWCGKAGSAMKSGAIATGRGIKSGATTVGNGIKNAPGRIDKATKGSYDGFRTNVVSGVAGVTGVGLGVGAVVQSKKADERAAAAARSFLDEYDYDSRDYEDRMDVFERDYQDYLDVLERDYYYEDAMFEREFLDELD